MGLLPFGSIVEEDEAVAVYFSSRGLSTEYTLSKEKTEDMLYVVLRSQHAPRDPYRRSIMRTRIHNVLFQYPELSMLAGEAFLHISHIERLSNQD